ncbi:hypothetical protein Vretifemale_18491 [Volvox reticuliferus]|uniref:CHRD domain-containing protein n=1 Tax=Volvox reticuliferus TaxID=1737510 RepID=A0A8J4CX76_9CHLO|nr:hypothetical protein Vretifemale_18491 [Volvox reticuliferus]
MSNLGDIFYLAVLVLAASAVNGRLAWPDAPYGSIVAVAKLTSRDKSSVVRGSMALVWPRPNMGNASVSLNLTGALDQITMAHIRLNATDTPIRLDLLPRYPDTAPVPLNPPLSFRGIMGFTVPFDYLRVGAWDPDNDHMSFIQALQEGLLYVSVQTAAMPGGALQGKLECQSPCMFSIGGGVVYAGR